MNHREMVAPIAAAATALTTRLCCLPLTRWDDRLPPGRGLAGPVIDIIDALERLLAPIR